MTATGKHHEKETPRTVKKHTIGPLLPALFPRLFVLFLLKGVRPRVVRKHPMCAHCFPLPYNGLKLFWRAVQAGLITQYTLRFVKAVFSAVKQASQLTLSGSKPLPFSNKMLARLGEVLREKEAFSVGSKVNVSVFFSAWPHRTCDSAGSSSRFFRDC